MTGSVREPQPGAARASRMAAWTARHVLAPGFLVGFFLSFIGAYGADVLAFWPRTAFFVAIGCIASALGAGTFRLVDTRLGRRIWLIRGAAAGLIMTLPMAIVVYVAMQIAFPMGPHLKQWPAFLVVSLVTSVFFCLAIAGLRRLPAVVAMPEQPSLLARFLDRLPPKLRGGELWALEAEDHYLRLHTSRGQDLILMRMADAVGELQELEGARVHRSWWVARDAIAGVKRRDGGATLILQDGAEVPVSRPNARMLRERGWI